MTVDSARTMARHIIEHYFGSPPKRLKHQGSGLSNFVFLVYHQEGEFVVRINPEPSKIKAFIKEQWAVNKAREVGVPVAEILEVGTTVIPYPYMIARQSKGKEATHHPARLRILEDMGRYAAHINSVATTGFGSVFDWSANQLSRNESWRAYLENELSVEARLELLESQSFVTPAQRKTLHSLLFSEQLATVKPSLNHGDVRLKNVIVDEEGTITAFIDWEHCVSNLAPYWELSLALHDLSIDAKEAFLQGYGLSAKQLAEVAPVMKAINFINYAPFVEPLVAESNTKQLELLRTRLSGVLDLYSL